MVEGTIDNKHQLMTETLTTDKVLCIGHNGAMTDHHTFRLSCSASGIKHIGCTLRYTVTTQLTGNGIETFLRDIALQGGHHTTNHMECKVVDQEINSSR